MVNTANSATGLMINRRIDPALDRRRLILFFAGLTVFYVAVLLITQPVLNGGEAELNKITYGVMLAPTVGAILACIFGPGLIRFGMPSWWILAAFLPANAGLPDHNDRRSGFQCGHVPPRTRDALT